MSIPTMPFHPPLRNVVLAASASLFGPGVLGLRGPSLAMGIACVPLLGALVFRLTGRARAAGLAALLLAVEPVAIFFSRQALQEVWTAFFGLLGALLVCHALASGEVRHWRWALPLAGVAFGAGVASKFYVVPLWGACTALTVWVAARQRRPAEALFAFSTLVPLALAVFLLAWTPIFAHGFSAQEWVSHQGSLFGAMREHEKSLENAFRFHRAGLWFVQPFVGWVELLLGPEDKPLAMTAANPLVWLLVLPSAAFVLWRGRAQKPESVLALLFLASWAPLVLASRPVWLISSQVVLPFALALVALAADALADRAPRIGVVAWLAAAMLAALLLYPGTIGRARDTAWLQPLLEHMGKYPAREYART